MEVQTLAITPVKLGLVRKWMKLWAFVASYPKKGKKINFFTEMVSIFSDRGEGGGELGFDFPRKKKRALTKAILCL